MWWRDLCGFSTLYANILYSPTYVHTLFFALRSRSSVCKLMPLRCMLFGKTLVCRALLVAVEKRFLVRGAVCCIRLHTMHFSFCAYAATCVLVRKPMMMMRQSRTPSLVLCIAGCVGMRSARSAIALLGFGTIMAWE